MKYASWKNGSLEEHFDYGLFNDRCKKAIKEWAMEKGGDIISLAEYIPHYSQGMLNGVIKF